MTPFTEPSRLFAPACSLALLFLLTACGEDAPIWNLTLRARHGEAWKEFTESPGLHFITEEGVWRRATTSELQTP
ncbi:Lipoprotein [Myxococcus xanthus]|nr:MULTISPECIES: hypothetical protein [Myxococcus]NOJ52395.1 hypothetical protein [Myxococcus xanthus]QVW67805.1 hypothetical protein JTM82_36860 [Myxococcus xanthus DZ2]QZZ54013.1 hypothetical protein MyxoNM_32795 [Myxococcus xanthus]UYI21033.1 hypothetical protein N1129_32615 [Myxococcus xanthus]SDW28879.1 hypothetical protein SAMN05444383_101937 [Myxococcus xanthus]